MKVIIAGTRTFNDYDLLRRKVDHYTKKLDKKKLIILSGHAKGADLLGEKWAYERRVTYRVFHAQWKKLGKKAGMVRNAEMVKEAKAAIFFWDGTSPGTKACIEMCEQKGIPVKIVYY